MATTLASLVSFLAICFGFLYAMPYKNTGRLYENAEYKKREEIANDVGLNKDTKVLPCSLQCETGVCDVATVNAECYDNFKPDFYDGVVNPNIISSDQEGVFHRRKRRNAINIGDWPKSEDGLIYLPYDFDNQVIEKRLSDVIRQAADEFEKHTCFRLKRRHDEDNYVSLVAFVGCWSFAGMQGGRQWLSLADHCGTLDTVLHEFMHAIGFHHEMSRQDRDKHIKIDWTNINPLYLLQFNLTAYGHGFTHGKDYDIKSLMHYGNKLAALNSEMVTMTSIKFPGEMLGPGAGDSFSDGDKRMINLKGFCDVDIKMHSGAYANANNKL